LTSNNEKGSSLLIGVGDALLSGSTPE